tara:strand:- start:84 stop:803 length:720 start_codon:yes stop_codon:yes gene_type:complete
MSDMKLIMENWRNFQLNEISGNDPVTYGLLKSILKLMTGIKQGLTGDALAAASGILGVVDSGIAKDIAKAVASAVSEGEEKEKFLLSEELLTIGALIGAAPHVLSALGAVSSGVKLVGLGKKLFNKLRGEPTEKTDKVPFLDLFNLDPKYAEIIDDRIEEEYLKWWLSQIDAKPDDEEVEAADLDVNLNLVKFLESEYGRQLTGHTAPGIAGSGTSADFKAIKKAARKKQAGAAIGKQL